MTTLWAGGGALIALAGLTAYPFGIVFPEPVKWACMVALAIWLAIPLALYPRRLNPAHKLALAFLAFAALSLIWSPDRLEGMLHLHNLTAAVAVYVGLSLIDRTLLTRAVPFVACLALIITLGFVVARIDSNGVAANPNFHAQLIIALLPLAASGWFAWRNSAWRFVSLCIAGAAFLFLAGFNPSHAKWLGFAGLAIGACIAWQRYALASIVSGLMIIGGAIAIAFDPGAQLSLWLRAEYIWNTLAIWLNSPLIGHGIGGFNHAYGDVAHLFREAFGSPVVTKISDIPGKAHSDPVELLATFGLIGLVIAILWLQALCKSRGRDGSARLALTALGGLGAMSLTSFVWQNPATTLCGVAALALISRECTSMYISVHSAHFRPFADHVKPIRRIAAFAVIGIALVIVVPLNKRTIEASAWSAYSKRISPANPVEGLRASNQAQGLMPLDFVYRLDPVLALAYLSGRANVRIAPQAADDVYRMARTSIPDHAAVLVARAAYLLNSGRWRTELGTHALFASIERRAFMFPDAWLVLAHYYRLKGDFTRARQAIAKAHKTGGDEKLVDPVAALIERQAALAPNQRLR